MFIVMCSTMLYYVFNLKQNMIQNIFVEHSNVDLVCTTYKIYSLSYNIKFSNDSYNMCIH